MVEYENEYCMAGTLYNSLWLAVRAVDSFQAQKREIIL